MKYAVHNHLFIINRQIIWNGSIYNFNKAWESTKRVRMSWYMRHLLYYSDIIMSAMTYQITDVSIVFSTVGSGADQGKHRRSASLAFVWGIHRLPVNSPHKGPVTWKMFLFDDAIMTWHISNKPEVSFNTNHLRWESFFKKWHMWRVCLSTVSEGSNISTL